MKFFLQALTDAALSVMIGSLVIITLLGPIVLLALLLHYLPFIAVFVILIVLAIIFVGINRD
jgi:hypothetical protein